MTLTEEVIKSLQSLPCFDGAIEIAPLSSGLSQTAIKVTSSSKVFFAKQLNEETAETEVSCALFCSHAAVQKDSGKNSKRQLSPDVIYHDHQWLVTKFISGSTLTDSKISKAIKVTTSLTLMAELHQLPACLSQQSLPILDTNRSTERLLVILDSPLAQHRDILNDVSQSLTTTINRLIVASKSPNVLCHGDMNFTNILLDNTARPWLIDYECAHIAPVEFDLAMLIAVNNIPTEQLTNVCTQYHKLNQHYHANYELLNHYLLYSFFINGLWYFNNKHSEGLPDELLHKLALVQWSAFDEFSKECSIAMPKLMSLLG